MSKSCAETLLLINTSRQRNVVSYSKTKEKEFNIYHCIYTEQKNHKYQTLIDLLDFLLDEFYGLIGEYEFICDFEEE